MSKFTWACFECRASVRREARSAAAVRCPSCGAPCESLGTRIPVPPKKDAKAWAQVRRHLAEVRAAKARQLRERAAFLKEHAARRIAKLEALPPNKERAREAKRLREELRRLEG